MREKSAIVKARTTAGVYNRPWTEGELQYLNDNYGAVSDKVICKHLKRSLAALHVATVRKLHINHKFNIYTARMVAELLGVKCSKTVTAWRTQGLLKGERSTVRCGGGFMWNFQYGDIEAFVRSSPWLFNPNRLPESIFRTIIKESFDKNPWYSLPQTCKMLQVSYVSSAMAFYIKKKWLHPIKKPIEGGNHWTWLFRKSDIDQFLAADPRRCSSLRISETRKLINFRKGNPVQIYRIWKMTCPRCLKTVVIEAPPNMKGAIVKASFIEQFTPKECSHQKLVRVDKPLKPYKQHKARVRR